MAKKSSELLYNDTKLRILQLYHHTLVNTQLRIIRKLELFVTFTVTMMTRLMRTSRNHSL